MVGWYGMKKAMHVYLLYCLKASMIETIVLSIFLNSFQNNIREVSPHVTRYVYV